MKKIIKSGLYIALCASLFACGGDGDNAPDNSRNPSEVNFSQPSGEANDTNAYNIAKGMLSFVNYRDAYKSVPAFASSGLLTKAQFDNIDFGAATDYLKCIKTEGTAVTTDFSCINDTAAGQQMAETSGCALAGKMTVTSTTDRSSVVTAYDNYSMTCDDENISTVLNGEQQADLSDPSKIISCWSMDITYNNNTERSEACEIIDDATALVFIDGESFGITSGQGNCTEGLQITGTDSDGSFSITCAVKDPATCTDMTEIVDLQTCTIS